MLFKTLDSIFKALLKCSNTLVVMLEPLIIKLYFFVYVKDAILESL